MLSHLFVVGSGDGTQQRCTMCKCFRIGVEKVSGKVRMLLTEFTNSLGLRCGDGGLVRLLSYVWCGDHPWQMSSPHTLQYCIKANLLWFLSFSLFGKDMVWTIPFLKYLHNWETCQVVDLLWALRGLEIAGLSWVLADCFIVDAYGRKATDA